MVPAGLSATNVRVYKSPISVDLLREIGSKLFCRNSDPNHFRRPPGPGTSPRLNLLGRPAWLVEGSNRELDWIEGAPSGRLLRYRVLQMPVANRLSRVPGSVRETGSGLSAPNPSAKEGSQYQAALKSDHPFAIASSGDTEMQG